MDVTLQGFTYGQLDGYAMPTDKGYYVVRSYDGRVSIRVSDEVMLLVMHSKASQGHGVVYYD